MKADPLDTILDDALTRLESGEASDDVLRRYPAYARQLRPLLETAVSIRQVSAVPFTQRGAIRGRLSQAVRSRSIVPVAYVWLAQRFFRGTNPLLVMKTIQVIVVALVVLVAGTVGVVAAANESSPGD